MLPEKNNEIVLNELFEDLNIDCGNSHDNLTFDYSIFYLSLLVKFRYSFSEAAYDCLHSFFVGLLSSGKITCNYYHVLMNALNAEYDYLYKHRVENLSLMGNSILEKYQLKNNIQ